MSEKSRDLKRPPNKLVSQKSPYLLQHAYNPVNWHPWGEEAFEEARSEDKPIFLSIGYSTCHWCHVMERESFEDEQVASLMNEAFVSIKVDREERPDIDSIYMAACQSMTGSGGWPLNIILTPNRRPFYAGTYIPKETKFGRLGMIELVPRIKELWVSNRDEVEKVANQNVVALKVEAGHNGDILDEDILHQAYEQLLSMFDEENGGFGDSPKFPTPHNILFLLRYWKRTGDNMALFMVEKTLGAMQKGGIYDHVGFGFHRYSVDALWRVPHFEKMLYDQAMIAIAYAEAFQATGKKDYEKTCREILSYVLRDMTSSEGGFYSGEDADSEGDEGKFYLWTEKELRQILPDEEYRYVSRQFNIKEKGNFPEGDGRNIFYLSDDGSDIPSTGIGQGFEPGRLKLFSVREKRIHPGKDDKILTDWNGLMIAAFAKASQVFDDPEYAKAARSASDFILSRMRREDGRLYHRHRDGETAISGFLDDHAFFIWGLLELYEATFEVRYLKVALEINRDLIKHFWDEEKGGFFITPDDGEELFVRKKDIYDGAIPSGNSVAMMNLLRLARITGDTDIEKKAHALGRSFSRTVERSPAAYTMLMSALDFAFGPSSEVVISGDLVDESTGKMLKALRKEFIPNKVVIFRPDGESEITDICGFAGNLTGTKGKAIAYVCRNFCCRLPTDDPDEMIRELHSTKVSIGNTDGTDRTNFHG
ncbi:MAG: thioredoxin domain-containing protein [Candidatus Methanoperedens sp.]|nr:thioredoxin domain-containing protein [Candidatus Methanoperedens sp.]